MSHVPTELGRRRIIIRKRGTTSVEARQNDYKKHRLLMFEGGGHHGKDKD